MALGLTPKAVRRARLQLLVFAPLFAGVILLWVYRGPVFGLYGCPTPNPLPLNQKPCRDPSGLTAVQIFVVLALVIIGWQLARDVGRGLSPWLSRAADAATAGTVGFLIRLVALILAIIVALRIADVSFAAIAIGASFSAVIVGLAAQQTLGNLIAGLVILSARPFRVGDTVRLQAGLLSGQIEGVVTSFGLMYTTFDSDGETVLVPNSSILASAIRPLREPEAVSLRLRLRDGRTPIELQEAVEEALTVPIRRHPRVSLEEVDGADAIVTLTVTPRARGDGARLSSELLAIVTRDFAAERGEGAADDQAAAT